MILRRDQTVAFRMRQAFRADKLPKPVKPKYLPPPTVAPASQAAPSTPPVARMGRFALPEAFADKQGLPVEFIRSLVAQGKLTHMKLEDGEIRILVAQAEKEIYALTAKPTPQGLSIDLAA